MDFEKPVKVIIERDDGQQLTIDNTTYIIPSNGLSGLDLATWELYNEKLAFRDGAVITNGAYSERVINLKFYSLTNEDFHRRTIRNFLNARNDYKLIITYRDTTRWIMANIEALSIPSENVYKRNEFEVSFFCADPFFNDMEESSKDTKSRTPRWGFPFIATTSYSPVMSVFVYGDYIFLDNQGDVAMDFTIKMTFKNEVGTPKFILGFEDEAKFFQVNHGFEAGDVLFIDFRNEIITVNGATFWSKVDPNSEILKVKRGGDWFTINTEVGSAEDYDCILTYNQKFAGM